jgi:hypothetical protein
LIFHLPSGTVVNHFSNFVAAISEKRRRAKQRNVLKRHRLCGTNSLKVLDPNGRLKEAT